MKGDRTNYPIVMFISIEQRQDICNLYEQLSGLKPGFFQLSVPVDEINLVLAISKKLYELIFSVREGKLVFWILCMYFMSYITGVDHSTNCVSLQLVYSIAN